MRLQDSTNQTTFSNAGAVNWLSSLEGFVDAGERIAYFMIAEEIRNQPILDLGVGAGRTIPLLRSLSTNYCAIDYLPIMVASARRRFPNVDIQLGDARDLSRFSDESFALAVFSYSGIDAVNHEDRQKILAEVRRVLVPNGRFWFSTLNKDGGSARARPWQQYRTQIYRSSTLRSRLSVTKELFESLYNYRRLNNLRKEGDGWLIAPFAAHAYGLLAHYITFDSQCDELARAGFEREIAALDVNGALINERSDLERIDFFNIVARKMPSRALMN